MTVEMFFLFLLFVFVFLPSLQLLGTPRRYLKMDYRKRAMVTANAYQTQTRFDKVRSVGKSRFHH
jgi:hypothetical protein